MRIGVTQRVEEVAGYGERRDCLDQAWTVLLEGVGLDPVPVPNRLTDPAGWCAGRGIGGLVLTGGNDLADVPNASTPAPERDATEAALLDWAAGTRVPVLGVCRGLQMIHRHLGGRPIALEGHAGTRHAVRVIRTEDPLFADFRDVNSFHDWGLPASGMPAELIPTIEAPDGTVEAVRHRELPWLAVMWHPERETPRSELDVRILESLFRTEGA